MKDYDDGRNCTQEFWKLAISSQIGMLESMANALDSLPKEMQGSWPRELFKSNAAMFNLYFRTMEQAGNQTVEMQSSALRQCSNTLRGVLSKMQGTDAPAEPEADPS
jgi:uncharacterized protein YukE